MASLEGISFDIASKNVSRTILSSVGGFSQPARRQIRSLQDLLATIQRFDLELFEAAALFDEKFVGEGVSYRVSSCKHKLSGRVVAVKRVKLPSISADAGAFERQIATVLRDVEVMSALRGQRSILNIFGYGWNVQAGSIIPFLVTEFAAEGTLRQFLKHNQVPAREKLLLCRDIAEGLHSLHVCGIAHGDLKLDNILITPSLGQNAGPGVQQDSDDANARSLGVAACISDFGHSLHLYDREDDTAGNQRYGGTLAYNAPEISRSKHGGSKSVELNFRKCDVWSLGLVFWELFADGHSYHHSPKVQEKVSLSQQRTRSSSVTLTNNGTQSSTSTLVDDIALAAPVLADAACEEVKAKLGDQLVPIEIHELQGMLRMALEPEPETRVADIPRLSYLFRKSAGTSAGAQSSGFGRSSWSFEIFWNAHRLPYQVKHQILEDCKRIATEPGQSFASSRAAFQASLAYSTGFGAKVDQSAALHWLSVSAQKGFEHAQYLIPVWEAAFRGPGTESGDLSYWSCLKSLIQRRVTEGAFAQRYLKVEDDGTKHLDMLPNDVDIDLGDESSVTFACKLGNLEMLEWLLNRKADPASSDSDDCNGLHWLAMFPDLDVPVALCLLIGDTDPGPWVKSEASSVERNINPQLPVRIYGTPLNFAVALGSPAAVSALLLKGSNPLQGVGSETEQESFRGSAAHTASKLHMDDYLKVCLSFIRGDSTRPVNFPYTSISKRELLDAVDFISRSFSDALPMERALLHGHNAPGAARRTLKVLDGFCRTNGTKWPVWQTLEPAVTKGDIDLIQMIIEYNAELHPPALTVQDANRMILGCTQAACSGSFELDTSLQLIQLALMAGAAASINGTYTSGRGRRPINIAIEHHRAEILDWFIGERADLNAVDDGGNAPLHHMVTSGFGTSYGLNTLLKMGASTTVLNDDQMSPIHLAINERNMEHVKVLMDHSSEVVAPLDTFSLLMHATRLRVFQAVSIILGSMRQNHIKPPNGFRDIIIHAVLDDFTELVTTLLEFDSSFDLYPLLTNAVSHGSFDCLNAILRFKGNWRQQHIHLYALLAQASEGGNADMVKLLLDCGANPSIWDHRGMSSLHIAVQHGHVEVVAALVKNGAAIDVLSNESETPLVVAITSQIQPSKRLSIIHHLLNAGANPNIANSDCQPALWYAVFRLNEVEGLEVMKLLYEHGALLNAPFPRPLLHLAIRHNKMAAATYLMDLGISVGTTDEDGFTALHECALALSPGTKALVNEESLFAERLLRSGVPAHATDKKGITALELASMADNGPVCLTLLAYFKERGKPSPDHSLHNLKPLDSNIVKSSWYQATRNRCLTSICAFLEQNLQYDTRVLRDDSVDRDVLEYAVVTDLRNVLIKFMGSSRAPEISKALIDDHLKELWTAICSALVIDGAASYLTASFRSRFLPRLHRFRLSGGYVPLLTQEELREKGFLEMQQEQGLIETLVDLEEFYEVIYGKEVVDFLLGNHESEDLPEATGADPFVLHNDTLGIFGELYEPVMDDPSYTLGEEGARLADNHQYWEDAEAAQRDAEPKKQGRSLMAVLKGKQKIGLRGGKLKWIVYEDATPIELRNESGLVQVVSVDPGDHTVGDLQLEHNMSLLGTFGAKEIAWGSLRTPFRDQDNPYAARRRGMYAR